MAQVMAKADMGLAARYADLVPDVELRDKVYGMIVEEYERTTRMYLAVTGFSGLLDDNPALERSVHNRFPYLEPLNHLQVELLRQFRAGDERDKCEARHPAHHERPRHRTAQQRVARRVGSRCRSRIRPRTVPANLPLRAVPAP